jgi:2-oxo-3-hexenedioate decarboxylase
MSSYPQGGADGAKVARIAGRLDEAFTSARAMPQPAGDDTISLAEAYDVQRALIDLRVGRGARRIGMKMGFTSRAKMIQMGLSDLIWGRLTSDMLIEDGGIDALFHIHPRVEIIDSRYLDFKFSLADVIADNASSSAVVVGAWHSPAIDFSNLGLVMEVDGWPVEIGSTAAILGHPLRSLCAASRLVAEAGETLEAGSIVMAGGATAAVAISPGASVRCDMQSLGRAGFTLAKAR